MWSTLLPRHVVARSLPRRVAATALPNTTITIRALQTSRGMARYHQRQCERRQASNNVGGVLVGLVALVSGTGSAVVMAYM